MFDLVLYGLPGQVSQDASVLLHQGHGLSLVAQLDEAVSGIFKPLQHSEK